VSALTILAELFIGIAGFSGIVVALSGAAIAQDPLDRFRVLSLLLTTLGGAVFAVLPIVLSDVGVAPERAWRLASGIYSVYLGLVAAWQARQRFSLPASAMRSTHAAVWVLAMGGQGLASIVLAIGATGWAGSSASAFYLAPLFYSLALACLLFVRLLLIRPGGSTAA
jgi:membrane glycosyltransferase